VRDPANGMITDMTLGGVTDHRTYDSFGQVATYEAKVGTTSLYSVVNVRDALGRIETKTETIQGTTTESGYSYDSSGRLWQVMKDGALAATYLYDANGNRLSKATPSGIQSATYDDQDRLLTYGKWAYTYTANGELRTKTDSSTGAVTRYSYDAAGNLRKVELSDGRVIEYVIDALGRRVAKMINGLVTRRWLYQGKLSPVAEFDGSGALVSRFAAGGVIKGSSSYRIVADHLGSPRLVVDTSTGAIVQRMEHDEWGVVTTDSAPGFTPFGFAIGIYDEDTQLVRFGERDYDPEAGRWTAKDPIGFGGQQSNLFTYVQDDPINLIDSEGNMITVNFAQWADNYAHPGRVSPGKEGLTTAELLAGTEGTCYHTADCRWKFDAVLSFAADIFYRSIYSPLGKSKESPGLTVAQHEALHVADYAFFYSNAQINSYLDTEGYQSRDVCEVERSSFQDRLQGFINYVGTWSHLERDILGNTLPNGD
jgi:RHS repeat-associated protein